MTALAAAICYLEGHQAASGEIPVLAGGKPDSSVFPTALAAHALSFAPGAENIERRALKFLVRNMERDGLWKHWTREHPYFAQLPPDLDDTSCASSALEAADREFPDNRKLLVANRNRSGLFYTWKLSRDQWRHPLVLLAFFRKTSAKPFDVDAVVNANILHYLGACDETTAVVDHLLRVLRERLECVCDKWYENPFAVWYFFSRALRRAGVDAADLLESRLQSRAPSNALELALKCCVLLDWDRRVDVAEIERLQMPSGAWPAAPLYHGGRRRRGPFAFDPPHPDTPHWGSEELTTAFCVEALARAAKRGGTR